MNNQKDSDEKTPSGSNFSNFTYDEKIGTGQDLKIQENIPLAPFTTFKIGGPAKFFCSVSTEAELLEAVKFAKNNKLEIFVLAGGSNILISDEGFHGLVIKLEVSHCDLKENTIDCGAGCSLAQIINLAKDNSLSGLEWAAGIPGSVGGAIRGNAGAYGGEIKDNLENVKVLQTKDGRFEIKNFSAAECQFGYRDSIFKKSSDLIILSGVLKLKKGDKRAIEESIKEVISKRAQKLPTDCSAGSFFQNPVVENTELIKKFELDVGCQCRGGKIPAGWLIDELGLRGKKMGGVMVSEKHANFVVNTDHGTAQDVIMLASFLKQQVRSKLGVQLREEIQYVGF